MNTQITIDQLSQLKLHGMARAYEAILSMPVQEQPTLNQFMARLVEAESLDRDQKKTESFLSQSKLRYNAIIEQVHCNDTRNLSKEKLMTIADCSFINRAENLIITGSQDVAKVFLHALSADRLAPLDTEHCTSVLIDSLKEYLPPN